MSSKYRRFRPQIVVDDYEMDVIRWWYREMHDGDAAKLKASDAQMVADFAWNAVKDKVMVQDEIRDDETNDEKE